MSTPTRTRYRWSSELKAVVPVEEAEAAAESFHFVHDDTMPALRHMADGRIYESKSRFRAATRAAGCIEVGNDPVASRPPSRKQRDEALHNVIVDVVRNWRA